MFIENVFYHEQSVQVLTENLLLKPPSIVEPPFFISIESIFVYEFQDAHTVFHVTVQEFAFINTNCTFLMYIV